MHILGTALTILVWVLSDATRLAAPTNSNKPSMLDKKKDDDDLFTD